MLNVIDHEINQLDVKIEMRNRYISNKKDDQGNFLTTNQINNHKVQLKNYNNLIDELNKLKNDKKFDGAKMADVINFAASNKYKYW